MPGPYEFIRVRDGAHEVTMPAAAAEAAGLKALSGKDALDDMGKPLPPTPLQEKAASAAKEG